MRGRANAGFTLVEIVVAITLLSLIMLGVGAALSTFAKTSEALDQRIDDTEEMGALSNLLYAILSSMTRGRPAGVNIPSVVFYGQRQDLRWLGVLPARYGAGGVNFFRLAATQAGGKAVLGLWFAPYVPGADLMQSLPAEPLFRLDGLREFQVRYRAAEDPQWRDGWDDAVRLPARIAVRVTTERGPWPDVVVAPEMLDSGRPGYGEVVIGGGAP